MPITTKPYPDPCAITEKVFQQHVTHLAKFCGWLIYHTWNSMRSTKGFPDLIMLKGERMIIAELKHEGRLVTPEQMAWLDAFQKLPTKSIEVYLWHPSDWPTIVEKLSGR